MWDRVLDMITDAKFYGNRLRGFGVTGPPPQTPFPILTFIALTTVSALPCCTVIISNLVWLLYLWLATAINVTGEMMSCMRDCWQVDASTVDRVVLLVVELVSRFGLNYLLITITAGHLSRFHHKGPVVSKFVEYKPNGLSRCGVQCWRLTASLKQSRKQSPNSRKQFGLSGATCHKDWSTRLCKTSQIKRLKACVGAWSWR